MINMNLSVMKAQATRPLMWVDRVLGGDREQHRQWRKRLERISRSEALVNARTRRRRALIANPRRWQRMRSFGRIGQWATVLPIGALTTYLTYLYMFGHGFGFWPLLLFGVPFLALPIVAKDRFERAALGTMAEVRGETAGARRASAAASGVLRSFVAGMSAGFSVTFVMALMSWFMTPAPTILQELVIDFMDASVIGVITGMLTAPLGLLMAIDPPSEGELEGPALPALLEGEMD